MKPQIIKVWKNETYSFSARQDKIPNINCSWHCHPELELIYFHRGKGTQFIGDKVGKFEGGNIVLLGSNLPHFWRYEDCEENKKKDAGPYATVIHFNENFWGDKFINLPELSEINELFARAQRGICIGAQTHDEIKQLILKISESDNIFRIIYLLQCLNAIANTEQVSYIASLGFNYKYHQNVKSRIDDIYDYTLKSFKDKIQLEDVAKIAGMTETALCRFFKSKTGKSYIQFLLEVRVGYACRLLIDNRYSVKQVCYDSGFNNFTSFYTGFKKITGKTPKKYIEEHSSLYA